MTTMTDGQIIVTDMPTDTAAMIWHALHQTKHAAQPSAQLYDAVIMPLTEKEQALYNELTDELTARAADAKAQRRQEAKP